jgi:hypothetical protein
MSFRVFSSLRWVWCRSRDHAALLPSFNAFFRIKVRFLRAKESVKFALFKYVIHSGKYEKLLLVCEFFAGSVVLLQAKV